jgi:hypothetical protein
MWIESEGVEGGGSTFCFTLPKRSAHAAEAKEEAGDAPPMRDALGD